MGGLLLSIAVNLLLLFGVFIYVKRRIDAGLSGEKLINDLRDEVNHLIVELNSTTERDLVFIEERITKLQRLIQEADKKILLLSRESERHRIGSEVYDKLKRVVPMAPKAQDPEPEAESAEKVVEKTSAEMVVDLHRKGFDPKIIASRTGSNLGEVELIISLENQKK